MILVEISLVAFSTQMAYFFSHKIMFFHLHNVNLLNYRNNFLFGLTYPVIL